MKAQGQSYLWFPQSTTTKISHRIFFSWPSVFVCICIFLFSFFCLFTYNPYYSYLRSSRDILEAAILTWKWIRKERNRKEMKIWGTGVSIVLMYAAGNLDFSLARIRDLNLRGPTEGQALFFLFGFFFFLTDFCCFYCMFTVEIGIGFKRKKKFMLFEWFIVIKGSYIFWLLVYFLKLTVVSEW